MYLKGKSNNLIAIAGQNLIQYNTIFVSYSTYHAPCYDMNMKKLFRAANVIIRYSNSPYRHVKKAKVKNLAKLLLVPRRVHVVADVLLMPSRRLLPHRSHLGIYISRPPTSRNKQISRCVSKRLLVLNKVEMLFVNALRALDYRSGKS